MPALGGERRAPPARAYADASSSSSANYTSLFHPQNLRRALLLLAGLLILRNILFKDYRQTTLEALKQNPQHNNNNRNPEMVPPRTIPRTAAEQEHYADTVEWHRLKHDVAYLLAQVAALQNSSHDGSNNDDDSNHSTTLTDPRRDDTKNNNTTTAASHQIPPPHDAQSIG